MYQQRVLTNTIQILKQGAGKAKICVYTSGKKIRLAKSIKKSFGIPDKKPQYS
jgi:hypothetical protein